MKKEHKKSVPQMSPENYVRAEDSIIQIKKKAVGLAFLIMGIILVGVAILFLGYNNSVADYVATIFMQFLPGIILIMAGLNVMKQK